MTRIQHHATLNKAHREGRTFYQLVCKDEHLCNFFDSWTFSLAKNKKHRTVRAYANALKRFVNYFIEAENQLGGSITNVELHIIIENYESYLAYGSESEIPLISNIGKAVPPGKLSGATIEQAIVALNKFIEASENFRISLLQLQEAGYINNDKLIGSGVIEKYNTASSGKYLNKAIKESSWLAGCINGGVKKVKQAHLKPRNKPSQIIVTDEFGGDDKTFPFDLAKDLIESAPNLRDKLLWSLIAASGIRISEAQTMFEADVVIQRSSKPGKLQNSPCVISKKVFVIDPDTRRPELIRYLSENEINDLPHKGRDLPDTYLIEPFASMFWRYLAEYKSEENKKSKRRRLTAKHPFLFKTVDTGEPVTPSYQTLYDSFSASARKLTGKSYGFHSLRHMYGYYIHNLAPVGNGKYGLPLKQVQMLMGHKLIKTTQRYARQDIMQLETAIGALNLAQTSDPSFSVDKAKLQYLKEKVAELESKIGQRERGELDHD